MSCKQNRKYRSNKKKWISPHFVIDPLYFHCIVQRGVRELRQPEIFTVIIHKHDNPSIDDDGTRGRNDNSIT